MNTEEQSKLLVAKKIRNPNNITIFGIVSGLCIWVIDALIDVYIIEPDEAFIESLLYAEGTELWMRFLVLVVLTVVGFVASQSVKKSQNLNILLFKYQFELEELVKTRTQALEERTDELEKQANTDSLTEIYNRRKFMQVASHELSRFKRHKHMFAILMLDIDDFKKINDNFGHDVGDKVIKKFAEIIQGETRDSDCFARWGGEEFIIMLPESDLSGRCILAGKLINLINNFKFDHDERVTVSIGVTSSVESDDNLDDIIIRADHALYKAKDAGKNTYKTIDG